jgi:8-oxo-dGTP pyrophosphatase MutT (NUDIX family)
MVQFSGLIAGIKKKMADPLPGIPSQLKMATIGRLMRDGKMVVPPDARKGSVLALFYPFNDHTCLVFIKRTEYPGVHSGQISFPGGGWEAGDQDMVATALREAEEEIGVDRNLVIPLGKLTDLFIPPSNFLVTPVVGYINERPDFRADPDEVDQILEISLDDLLNEENRQEREITIFPAIQLKVPCFYIDGNIIWGATAMMLSELMDVINQGS